MKKSLAITLLLAIFTTSFSVAASSNKLESSASTKIETSSKKELRKEKRMKKLVEKIKKKFAKLKPNKKVANWSAGEYLTYCLVLLLAAVLLFALANITIGLFNFIGSLALLGSIVFFVLWILEYTGNL